MMPSFHDFIFAWAIGVVVFIAIFAVLFILYGIAMAIRFSIGILIAFFYHVAKQMFNLAKWVIGSFLRKCKDLFFGGMIFLNDKRKQYLKYILKKEKKHKNSWLGRNFDFISLFYVSVPLLFVFSLLSFWDLARDFIKDFTLLIGALLGFPILIKRVAEMQEQTHISREQLHFSQFADAYGKLWSPDLGTRMTAIESLWRFAQKHPQEQYSEVMDVFTHFIKHPAEEGKKEEAKKAGKRPDISAILRHMGKETMAGAESYPIDLSGAHLEGANLLGANLEGANLRDAHLGGARLYRANLKRARLSNTHLEGANLWRIHLQGARLWSTHLEGANLRDSHLEGSYLRHARLERARLYGAHLEGADLHRVHLTLTIINNADFSKAVGLTQAQIDKCVFITDDYMYESEPLLPEGLKFTGERLSRRDWRKACREQERGKYDSRFSLDSHSPLFRDDDA